MRVLCVCVTGHGHAAASGPALVLAQLSVQFGFRCGGRCWRQVRVTQLPEEERRGSRKLLLERGRGLREKRLCRVRTVHKWSLINTAHQNQQQTFADVLSVPSCMFLSCTAPEVKGGGFGIENLFKIGTGSESPLMNYTNTVDTCLWRL